MDMSAFDASFMSSTVLVAGYAMPIRITNGTRVQMISMVVFSWNCAAFAPTLLRCLKMDQNIAARVAGARRCFESMASPFSCEFLLVRGHRDPPAQILRELPAAVVGQQPPQRYHPPRVREAQHAAVAVASHDHTCPRAVRRESRDEARVARLHTHLVLADLEPLAV